MEKKGLEFPCRFPVKTIGRNTGNFEEIVVAIVRRHVPDLQDEEISRRLSRDGKYLSVTTTFIATSQAQLDDLYYELSRNELVMLIL